MIHRRRRIMKKNSRWVKRQLRIDTRERANDVFGVDQLLENYPLEDEQDEEYSPELDGDAGDGMSLTDLPI